MAMLAAEIVRDVTARLGERGIAVMVLKGALLQRWLYEDPSERPLTDVDMLVAPGQLESAREALQRCGYRETGRARAGAIELSSPFRLTLDLHPHLFHPSRYRLSTGGLFARSTVDEALFEAPVRIPSPVDAYAHAIGKFGSDHLNATAVAQLGEIARIGSRISTPADEIAAHLSRCGMRRVARYVLPLVHETTADALSRTVLHALDPDPVGRSLATLSRAALNRLPNDSRTGAIFAHLLNHSIPRALHSGLTALRGTRSTCLNP